MAIALERGRVPANAGGDVYQRMLAASGLPADRFAAAVKESFTIGNVIDLGTSHASIIQDRADEATQQQEAPINIRHVTRSRLLPATAAAGLLVALAGAATQNETVMHTVSNAKSQADNLVGTVLAGEFIASSPPEVGYTVVNGSENASGSIPGQPMFVGSRLMLDQIDILDRLQKDPDASFSISIAAQDPSNPLIRTTETVFAYQNGRQTAGQDIAPVFLPESEAVDGIGGPFLPLLHSYTEPVEIMYEELDMNGSSALPETTRSLKPDTSGHIAPTDETVGIFLVAANDEARDELGQAVSGSSEQLQHALDMLPPQFLTGNIYVANDSDFASDDSFAIIEDGVVIRRTILDQLQEPQRQQYILEAMFTSSLSRMEITDENFDNIYRETAANEQPTGPTAKARLRSEAQKFARQIDSEASEMRDERRRFYNAIDDALGISGDRRMLEDENYKNADLVGARVLTLMSLDIEQTARLVNPRETTLNSVNRIDDLKKLSDAAFLILKYNASNNIFVSQEALDRIFGWGMSALQYHGLIDPDSWAYNDFMPYLDDPAIKAARLAALRSAGLSHSDVAYWDGSPDGGAVSAGWNLSNTSLTAPDARMAAGGITLLPADINPSVAEYLLTHGPFSSDEIPQTDGEQTDGAYTPR